MLVVALDAVVGMVQRGSQVHSMVGEPKTFPVTPTILWQTHLNEIVSLNGLDGNQVVHVELVGRFEENSGMMPRLTLGSEHGPLRVASGGGQFGFVVRFAVKPAGDVTGERSLRQRFAQESFEIRSYGLGIKHQRLFPGDIGERFALDEAALYRIERSEMMVALLKSPHVWRDVEKIADKILKMRRERDDELRGMLRIERGRIFASGQQMRRQFRGAGTQVLEKRFVHARQSFAGVEILKRYAKG